jgi:diaminohydroxyphosphoribosylaminopyrimidine deaminase/5-amino-6-(5-phosphoribosylamino)uracil reductase
VNDRYWMEQALALGALADEDTSPNPRVGCIVVKDDRVVGRGLHRAPGLPHAEVLALGEARSAAQGATLYVNLEPCGHHGRTPPCAELVVRSGIVRVCAAMQDPNPLVDGRGFAILRAGGVRVEIGLLADASAKLNEAFVHFHRERRPLVTLKAAASLDGMTAARAGRSRWISGEAARRFAHRLRLRHDAILVGAETVRRDDPLLTIRLPGVHRARWRVVLAPRLDLDPGARLFQAGANERRPRVYGAETADPHAAERLAAVADVVRVPLGGDRLDLDAVLGDLARLGVQSLLVEGGARTFAAFLEAGRADRLALFLAPRLIGARGGTPLIDLPAVDDPSAAWRLAGLERWSLGEDLLLYGRIAAGSRPG